MALLRKLFYRKPPDGLLEICERVYVFDCCFTLDSLEEPNYKGYVGSIISQIKEHYPDATILAFNFREGDVQSQIANALTEYDMTIMEYPRQYEGCPLLPMEVIHHFLRSSESWLQLGLQNLLLMHCEPGGWPVLAFMLAALLIYRKHYTGELKTLDMVYRQAPRELLQLLSPLNPIPSQLRYLQYVSRRNVATEWPPLDRALTMDCVIIRMIPNFDGGGGCRPIFRIYGQDPLLASDRAPKILYSTPKKSRTVRHYKQAECELVKIDINCHIQGDVVLECICLHDDMEREEMMFRAMFNTAFIRSNILMLNRDDIDILWDAKDQFPKDFRAEVLFSEMDTAVSVAPADYSCFEEKDGLPVEAFAKVQEMFSSVDWLVPKGDGSSDVPHHLHVPNTVNETDSHADKSPAYQSPAASEAKYVVGNTAGLSSNNALSTMSPNADVGRMQNDPTEVGEVKTTKQILVPPPSSHLPTITKVDHISPKQQSMSNAQGSDAAKCFSPLREADTPKQQSKSSAQESDMCKSYSPLGEADKSSSKTFLSTPSNQPSSKDADVDRGKPLFSPKTPILEDNIGIQSPGTSTTSSKEETTTRTSSTSRESPKTHDEVKDGPPKSEPPRATTSSTDDTNYLRPPSLSPPTHSSSVLGVGKSTGGESTSSRPSLSKTEVSPKPAPGGSPSHLSSLETEVAVKNASGETAMRDPSLPKTNAPVKPSSPHLSLSKTDGTPKIVPGGSSSPHLSSPKTDVAPKTAPRGPPSPHLSSLKTEVTSESVPPESTPKTDVSRKTAASRPPSDHLSLLKTEVTHTTASGETATRDPYLPKTDVTSKTSSSKSSSPHLSLSKTDVVPKTGLNEPSSHSSKDVPPNIAHGGPPAPHLSSHKTEVYSATAPGEPASPPTSPPKTNVTPKTKSRPPPISTSTDNSAGPPSPDASPLSPHLRHCSPKKRSFPTPESSNENLFFKERLLLKPPRPPALDSPSKKQSSSGVAPVAPTPPSIDKTITRPTPSPPPPAIDNTITRPTPSPPPPPPVPAKESPWPPPPPPLPSSHQNAGSENAKTLSLPCPPPPPTTPAAPPPSPTAPAAPPPPASAPAAPSPPPPPAAPSVPSAPPPPASPAVPSAPPPPGASSVPLAPPISSSRGNTLPGAPSPPPPSAPPPGAKGKSLFARNAASKNNQKKLKPLHWLKLTRAVTGSLWAEAQKSGEATKAPEIDISELESLFSAAVPNAGQGGSSRKGGSRAAVGNKPEKVQLIDHRRAYNCEIMLSKVKIPLHDVLTSVLALEDSALDPDQVDNLIKFCPTKDEMEVLKGYKGERDKLGKCEQFFTELMQVPRIEYKLRVFSFKIQFCSQVSDLRNSLNVVNSAADQIRGSAKLKRIMQTILSLGNALNQGTARGSAVGFRLDSLLKLTETRARNNKMTLMHYLCKVLSDKLPELLDFWQELSSLEPSAKIQLKFLAEEMQAINKGLEKVVQELSMSESDGPVSDQFRKALKEFLGFSEGEVRSLASLYAGVGRNVDSLILYFGEDPSRCPFEQVISTLLNFVKMFKKCHDENCKQQEFERKKAEKEKEKEASEKLKMNGSDTAGHLLQPSPVK